MKVLCTSSSSLWQHLGKASPGSVNPDKLYACMQSSSRQEIASYLSEGNKMFYATVGVNDVLFMPPGFTFVEKVSSSSDSVGARQLIMSSIPSHTQQLTDVSMLLLSAKCGNEMLSRVVDGLVLKGP